MDSFNSLRELIHDLENYHDSYTKLHEDNVGKLMGFLGNAIGLDKSFYRSHE